MITGLLIKPDCCRVEPVTLDPKDDVLDQVYQHLLIANTSRMVTGIGLDAIGLPWTDTLLVDEEGRLNGAPQLGGFSLLLPGQQPLKVPTLVGRGLILRINKRGNFVSPRIRDGVLRSYIHWHAPQVRRVIHPGTECRQ